MSPARQAGSGRCDEWQPRVKPRLRAAATVGLLIVAVLAAASLAPPALAADDLVGDGWHFQLTPLVWAAQLDTGSVTVKGQKVSPDIQVHDYIDKVQGLVEFDAQLRNGRFGFQTLFIYMDL